VNAEAEATKQPAIIDTLTSAKDTTSIKLASVAEIAVTAKPKALEPLGRR